MVIADTGFWVALINRRDDFHERAKQKLAELSRQNETLITTCAVMAETSHLWLSRVAGLTMTPAVGFLRQVDGEALAVGSGPGGVARRWGRRDQAFGIISAIRRRP